jgi:hypothetical protein
MTMKLLQPGEAFPQIYCSPERLPYGIIPAPIGTDKVFFASLPENGSHEFMLTLISIPMKLLQS